MSSKQNKTRVRLFGLACAAAAVAFLSCEPWAAADPLIKPTDRRPSSPAPERSSRMPPQPALVFDPRSSENLVRIERVQDELGFSDEQAESIRQLQRELEDEYEKAINKIRDRFSKESIEILSDKQKKRLRGISLQAKQTRAYVDPAVIAEIGITETQRQAMDQVFTSNREESGELMRLAMSRKISPSELQKRGNALSSKIKMQLRDVLTPAQQMQMDALLGDEFLLTPQDFIPKRDSAPKFLAPPQKTNR